MQFVDALDLSELRKLLVNTTYKYIRVLLATDRIKTNSGERTLLRNLGSWLGRLTIMKNKPLRARDLDLKEILYEAYEQGKMIAVLPFIGKVRNPLQTQTPQSSLWGVVPT
jgi:CCR4-NOT transcription complex subunit 1